MCKASFTVLGCDAPKYCRLISLWCIWRASWRSNNPFATLSGAYPARAATNGQLSWMNGVATLLEKGATAQPMSQQIECQHRQPS